MKGVDQLLSSSSEPTLASFPLTTGMTSSRASLSLLRQDSHNPLIRQLPNLSKEPRIERDQLCVCVYLRNIQAPGSDERGLFLQTVQQIPPDHQRQSECGFPHPLPPPVFPFFSLSVLKKQFSCEEPGMTTTMKDLALSLALLLSFLLFSPLQPEHFIHFDKSNQLKLVKKQPGFFGHVIIRLIGLHLAFQS